MYPYIFALVILFVLYTIYTCIIKPQRTMNWYEKNCKQLNYKVKVIPFKAFSVPFDDMIKEDRAKGDAMRKAKEEFLSFDIVIFNVLNQVFIYLINPKLIQSFYSPEHIGQFKKFKLFYQ